MRTGTQQQTNIIDADVIKISWLFEVDVGNTGSVDYYWSTKAKTYGGQPYTFKILDFSPIQITKGYPELGILPENRITVNVSFKDNIVDAYHASDFEGAAITIRLIGEASLGVTEQAGDIIEFDDDTIVTDLPGEEETELMSWCFKVTSSMAINQKMTWECVDWFSEYLQGDYPNTPLLSDLFPADIMKDDTYCVPLVFGTCYFPLRWIYTGGSDYYVLGPSTPTYTIDRCRAPIEDGGNPEYPSSTYTFTQSNQTGSDSNTYKCVKAIIVDSDNDGTDDANGMFGYGEKNLHDVPFKFYRSDLSSMTNPANIIEYILEDMGVPSAKIDATAQTTAAAVFTSRGITLNIPLWYKMPRKRLLCKILAMSGMVLLIRDKVYMKVLTKTSQLAIEKNLVLKRTFRASRAYTEKQKDSGYVVWQKSTEPLGQGQENKSIISAKSGTSNPSSTTIECEWVSDDDGVKQQKAGKLALQRNILTDKRVYFSAKGKLLFLEPGDVITINPADYGTEGSSYDILTDKMLIYHGLKIDFECTRFSDDLDDWGDLSASSITVGTAVTTDAYRPIMQGGRDALADAGDRPNDITSNVYIAGDGVLATNDDPATNGGFIATNTELTCYNTNGDIRFQAIYSGANQGDVTIGNYSGNQGVFWDQSEGTFDIRGALNADDIDAGTLTSRTVQTASSGQRIVLSADDNEAHFYGDRGDETVEELCTIGISTVGSDQVIGYFGSTNSSRIGVYGISDSNYGIYGKSNGSAPGVYGVGIPGVYGESINSYGVKGNSTNSHGGYFSPSTRIAKSALNCLDLLPETGILKIKTYQESMDDEDYFDLPDATEGILLVSVSAEAGGQMGMFQIRPDGATTKISGSTYTSDSNDDGYLCVYDPGGTTARVYNRLGATRNCVCIYFYS